HPPSSPGAPYICRQPAPISTPLSAPRSIPTPTCASWTASLLGSTTSSTAAPSGSYDWTALEARRASSHTPMTQGLGQALYSFGVFLTPLVVQRWTPTPGPRSCSCTTCAPCLTFSPSLTVLTRSTLWGSSAPSSTR